MRPAPASPPIRTADNDQWLSPDASAVVFANDRAGHSDLYATSTTPGSLTMRLTDSLTDEQDPTYAPSGHQIAFVCDPKASDDREIMVLPAYGGAATNVSNSRGARDVAPSWESAVLEFTGPGRVYWLEGRDAPHPARVALAARARLEPVPSPGWLLSRAMPE